MNFPCRRDIQAIREFADRFDDFERADMPLCQLGGRCARGKLVSRQESLGERYKCFITGSKGVGCVLLIVVNGHFCLSEKDCVASLDSVLLTNIDPMTRLIGNIFDCW